MGTKIGYAAFDWRFFAAYAPLIPTWELSVYNVYTRMAPRISHNPFVSGVLWNGGDVIKDSNAVVNKLQELGKKVFLVTNNSTKSRDEYVAKCAKLGFNCNEVSLDDGRFLSIMGIYHL